MSNQSLPNRHIVDSLRSVNEEISRIYPGDSPARQPVHTVYGGAQIFNAETALKLGVVALATFRKYAPTPSAFASALKLTLTPKQQKVLYTRIVEKLKHEPVEDFRIDFEDGYGNRPESEEDGHAAQAAGEVARGMREGTLPPFIGIRIKPFTEELKHRSIRTLEIFLNHLLGQTGGKLPEKFYITLPKITHPAQVNALVRILDSIEASHKLAAGSLKIELMIETPQSLIDQNGKIALPLLIAAADGRCTAAHLGIYDFTASLNITASYQSMDHPSCDFARQMMKVGLAGTGVWLSDGATNIMPVGPHRAAGSRALNAKQERENRIVVHRAWKLAFDHTTHSLVNGIYQGWDLHPAQLPVRYAAVYAFFLQSLESASFRLKTFIERAAQATLVGDIFDDAATGQGLLNYFLRGINCGAITEAEATATGLSVEEIQTRSFVKILSRRRTG